MTYGPCGGVGPDGLCEVLPDPCVFLDAGVVPWPAAAASLRDVLAGRRLVVATLPDAPLDAVSIAETAAVLRGVDAVVIGDSGRARVQFPPSYRAMLVQQAGVPAWVGLNCRDRNRVALEGELAALAHLGVAAVHCVTGDHPVSGHRPDAQPVFDLESHELVALARAAGLVVSVAESPAAPPVAGRAARVAQKVRAGADVLLPQYCGDPSDVAAFIAAVRAAGAAVPVLPGVPVVIDKVGAELLASFAAAVLPTGYAESVLAADDPVATGIALAVEYGRALLSLDDVAGVVLGGGARPGAERAYAEAEAEIAAELRA